MRLCKDCTWYGGYNSQRHVCLDPRNWHLDPVTGEMISYDASWLRKLAEQCGPEGKWWRPAPPPKVTHKDA